MGEQARAVAEPAEAEVAPRQAAKGPGEARRILGLTRLQLGVLAGIVLAVHLPFLLYLVRGEAPVTATLPFSDDFNRAQVGENYFTTGGHWRIENGVLHSPGVKNNPLWLKARLPDEVAIEFDARSESKDGDIKCEVFGNGFDHSSGYVIIFGGWSNSISVIARLDEHGRDRIENRSLKVEKGRTYRFRIERRGGTLRWYLDGSLAMELSDKSPLGGKGHDRFGLSSWDSDVFFDNLKIEPL
ncbi:MAG: hypothetical protein ACOX6T_16060 [Myxococcales bacterium]|jgi:hypothetical protein